MRSLTAFALIALMSTPVLAAESPLALVDQIYAPYLSDTGQTDYAATESEELARIRSALQKRIDNGEDVAPDFDPFIAGQDFKLSDFKAELGPDSNEYSATIEVSFKNFDQPVSLDLVAFNYDGDWRLEDVVSKMAGNEYTLSDVLSPKIVYPEETFADPRSVAEALYSPYSDPDFQWRSWDESQFMSSGLNALYERDRQESEERQEVGRLDFDPFINGQDFEVKNLTFGEPQVSGETAQVAVTFTNFDRPQTVTLHLVREDGRWKVDDAANDDKDYPYRLREILEAPLPE